jgi:glycosyltransferase involved in cell wall biosynthesis
MAGDDRPLRVVFVNHVSLCSGAEFSLLSLLRHVREYGVEPHALVPEGDLAERLRALEIPVTLLPNGRSHYTRSAFRVPAQLHWMHGLRRRAVELCRSVGADLLHANSKAAALSLALPGSPLPPLVWHCRDLLASARPIRWLAPRCAGIVAISRVVERHIGEAAPRHARTAVIYNGLGEGDLRLSREPAEVRREFGLSPEAPVVVSVGQLTPWKRHELTLEAAELLRAAHPDLRWWIAGEAFPEDAAYAERLRASAPENVTFTGYRSDVADLVRAADLCVHPATTEAFGRAVLESMVLGTPCVAARAGGLPELLEDGQSGLLVEPGEAPALAAGVERLLGDAALRERLGAGAQARAETFSAARTAAQTVAFYRHLLGGGKI